MAPRRILILTHTGREDAIQSGLDVADELLTYGLQPVMMRDDAEAINQAIITGAVPRRTMVADVLEDAGQLGDIDLCVVLGGDGSVLRAAELVRGTELPLLAVNLGHIGFLAESERTDIPSTVAAVAEEAYDVEERMTIDVRVLVDDQLVARTWALNEASVEKSNRERTLEVVIGVDDRPISTFGCDGVVMATPTGSTAYAFSAGGPVVWPEVETMLMVPLSAHALFARPLVVSPRSVMSVDVLQRTNEAGVLWCDGRRTVDLPQAARVEVTRSDQPVRLARLSHTPFSERLVRKFKLPTKGWRGSISEADRAEIAARSLARRQSAASTGSSGVEVVEPHHLAPKVEVTEPRTTELPVVTKADEKNPLVTRAQLRADRTSNRSED
ncbi:MULTISPECIES: NAD kinase [Auritidibacter]|uniref:NAD kinase n=1 Tax=Auritidibacter ignavus TaxID=678932 RepID=A0AAJ6AKP0_9MICC|nr:MULTISPECIES: NAD kinase [Auritidibacter]PXA80449.1 NAD kinase [Auritidibacter sp. NML120779]AXR73735.1 NAD kinase [Auritidibacter sp. NML130574]NIH72375.1 NAD+ kinase [Auritidibacter ignavus]PXA76362.1 NAD kinase [Auritidibacter sp. NML100628]PXA81342.1 NAD kinase [Auritidibacter sp. NML120636]